MRRLLVSGLVSGALLALAACAQQPPPPPVATNPPPPPPPPPTTYTVYFDYNSSQLGPAAREVVRFAADTYKAGAPSTVQVTGYTDPSGSAGYISGSHCGGPTRWPPSCRATACLRALSSSTGKGKRAMSRHRGRTVGSM